MFRDMAKQICMFDTHSESLYNKISKLFKQIKEAKMNREEKCQILKEKAKNIIAYFKGEYDHIQGMEIDVDIKKYFPHASNNFGSWIAKLYENKVEIVCPQAPICSMIDTPCENWSVRIDELSEEDLDKILGQRLFQD